MDTHALAKQFTAADFTPTQADTLTDAFQASREELVTHKYFDRAIGSLRKDVENGNKTTRAEISWEISQNGTKVMDIVISAVFAIVSIATGIILWALPPG